MTAILNTNAFWTYLLSVWIAHVPWQPKRLLSVLFAVSGVFLIVYGQGSGTSASTTTTTTSRSNALLGDVLTLVASVGYSIYQVMYKKYIALPNRVDQADGSIRNGGEEDDEDKAFSAPYSRLPTTDPRSSNALSGNTDVDQRYLASSSSSTISSWADQDRPEEPSFTNPQAIYPSFGLHPNFITSCLGLTTLLFLWPPLIYLHKTGIEPFRLPPDARTWLSVGVVAGCGVMYNAGFMVSS